MLNRKSFKFQDLIEADENSWLWSRVLKPLVGVMLVLWFLWFFHVYPWFVDVDLKKATKTLSNKFACGCSVAKNATGINEVILQGDVIDDVCDFLAQTFEVTLLAEDAFMICDWCSVFRWLLQINEDDIEIIEDKKGKR